MEPGQTQAHGIAPADCGAEPAMMSPDAGMQLAALYREHVETLKRYIAARFGPGPPEPDEVVQATFAKLAAGDVAAVRDPRAFLYTMACNFVIDHHRQHARRDAIHRDIAAAEENLSDFSPEHVLMAREEFAVFKKALKKMPAMRRRIFLMVRSDGTLPIEVARRFGVTENAIHQHVSRALADCEAAFRRAKRKESGW